MVVAVVVVVDEGGDEKVWLVTMEMRGGGDG